MKQYINKYTFLVFCLFLISGTSLVSCKKSRSKTPSSNPGADVTNPNVPNNQTPSQSLNNQGALSVSSSGALNGASPTGNGAGNVGSLTPNSPTQTPTPSNTPANEQNIQNKLSSIDTSYVRGLSTSNNIYCDPNQPSQDYWTCVYKEAYLATAKSATSTSVERITCSKLITTIDVVRYVYSYTGQKPAKALACQVSDHLDYYTWNKLYQQPVFISFSSPDDCSSNSTLFGLKNRAKHYTDAGYTCRKNQNHAIFTTHHYIFGKLVR